MNKEQGFSQQEREEKRERKETRERKENEKQNLGKRIDGGQGW